MLQQLNRSDYAAHNSPYNGLMSTIVDSILGTKQAYPSYIPIREFISQWPSAAQAHKEIVVVKAPAKRPLNSRIELDTTGLDAYENVVFSSLVWGSYSLYCLVGEMGSGKTALVAQLASVLSRRRTVACTSCGATSCIPIVVTLDFNEGFAKTVSTDEIVRRFEKRMFAQLNARLKTLL